MRIFDRYVKYDCQKMDKNSEIQQKIFLAAQKLFLQKGWENTSMSDIAQEVGISRTSLNYYFRTKEQLFNLSVNNVAGKIIPKVNEVIAMDLKFVDKVILLVHNYIDLLKENEFLPRFVFLEINRSPQFFIDFFMSQRNEIDFSAIHRQMEKEIAEGSLCHFPVSQLVFTIPNLCVFPFLTKPLLDEVLPIVQEGQTFDEFLEERKEFLATMIRKILSN